LEKRPVLEKVVKRTVRYRFWEGIWNNGGMVNENEKVKIGSGHEGPSGLATGTGPNKCGIRNAECGTGEGAAGEVTGESKIGDLRFERGKAGKTRSDSILGTLPPEQQAKVKTWLFEENLSFGAVMGRCQRELGVEVSKSSVMRYYRREASVRRLENSLWRRERSPDPAGNANEFYEELMAMAGEMALESARGEADAEKRRAFVECTKLLIAARREGNYARRVDLARERFEFDAATACIMRQMEINSIVEDETLTDEERIRSVREELFGENLPE
jgi:hypothetical protein